MQWFQRFFTAAPEGPDRVERLLTSCRSYYRDGDLDIAVLLLREAEQSMTNAAAIREGTTLVGRAPVLER